MAGLSNHFRAILTAAIAQALLAGGAGWAIAEELAAGDTNGPVMIGELTRQEIEAALPDWVEEEIAARPDVDSAEALMGALPGSEVTVLLGTWCSDSRRELARLWRAMDEVGALDPDQVRYIGVGRDLEQPARWVAGQDLQLVPTFVVQRHGEEVGRIVESSPNGIEVDLLALLTGETSGVITANAEYESNGGDR